MLLPFLPVEAAKKPKKFAKEQVVSLKPSHRPVPVATIMGAGPGDRGDIRLLLRSVPAPASTRGGF